MATHDLGGTPGFGPVPVDDDAIFHAEWERRTFGVTQFAQSLSGFNTDAFRHGIERESSERYFDGYWQRWLSNAERMLIEGGVLAAGAVDAAIHGEPVAGEPRRTTDAEPHGRRGNIRPLDIAPRFGLGAAVRTVDGPPHSGHHRLPAYAFGKVGIVRTHHGGWVFPDTHAHGRGEQPCHVYTVGFLASDLWPDDSFAAEGGTRPVDHTVCLDVFEPYLESP